MRPGPFDMVDDSPGELEKTAGKLLDNKDSGSSRGTGDEIELRSERPRRPSGEDWRDMTEGLGGTTELLLVLLPGADP